MILLVFFLLVFNISVIHEGSCKKIFGEHSYEEYDDLKEYSDEEYSDGKYSDEKYSDEKYSDEKYSDEEYSNESDGSEKYSFTEFGDEESSDDQYDDIKFYGYGCKCPTYFNPVCASDGKTYTNTCNLECRRNKHDLELGFVYRGNCKDKRIVCLCQKKLEPFCGSDGETYANICFLQCAKKFNPQLKLATVGECVVDPKECSCPDFLDPMCASDGKTYGNGCFLECAQRKNQFLNFVSNGDCNSKNIKGIDNNIKENDERTKGNIKTSQANECSCPQTKEMVCGSDGQTYKNNCFMVCERDQRNPNLRVVSNGPCNHDDKTSQANKCSCSKTKEIVCGSDGKTYINNCFMVCQRDKSNPYLRVVSNGPCNSDDKTSQANECLCPKTKEMVCGSNGKTYINKCFMVCERNKRNPNLRVISNGPCNPEDMNNLVHTEKIKGNNKNVKENTENIIENDCPCPKRRKKVCGSDAQTYLNVCFLACERNKKPGLKVFSKGRCKPDMTSLIPEDDCQCQNRKDIVCGSDGQSYLNTCFLVFKRNKNPGLKVISKGPCSPNMNDWPNKETIKESEEKIKGSEEKIKESDEKITGIDEINDIYDWINDYIKENDEMINGNAETPDMYAWINYENVKESDDNINGNGEMLDMYDWLNNENFKGSDDNINGIGETPDMYDYEDFIGEPNDQNQGSDDVYDWIKQGQNIVNDVTIDMYNWDPEEKIKENYATIGMNQQNGYLDRLYKRLYNSTNYVSLHNFILLFKDLMHNKIKLLIDPCNCPAFVSEVCGSDGKTYFNRCILECVRRIETDLKYVSEGTCNAKAVDDLFHDETFKGNDKNCNCPKIAIYICGSDGETYPNRCTLECARLLDTDLKYVSDGACNTNTMNDLVYDERSKDNNNNNNCYCPKYVKEVCGSDGKTYTNGCILECARLTQTDLKYVSAGACKTNTMHDLLYDSNHCNCPKIVRKVCGSDGNTYTNLCYLNCARLSKTDLKFVSNEACNGNIINDLGHDETIKENSDKCECPNIVGKVCGSDDKTYINRCFLECAKQSRPDLKYVAEGLCIVKTMNNLVHKGKTNRKDECSCPKFKEMVCGSDGKTYLNNCFIACERKARKPNLIAISREHCNTDLNGVVRNKNCPCPKFIEMVCGSDGRTYLNTCFLVCEKKHSPQLKIVSYGRCNPKNNLGIKVTKGKRILNTNDDCHCPTNIKMVCGSDGKFYKNLCWLQCKRKQNRALHYLPNELCNPIINGAPNTKIMNPNMLFGGKNTNGKNIFKEKDCPCPKILEVICGSDGRTYENLCLLDCAQKQNPNLRFRSKGACTSKNIASLSRKSPSQDRCVCPKMFTEVCGSDGKTYDNLCMLECAKKENPSLYFVEVGKCTPKLKVMLFTKSGALGLCRCPKIVRKVCGSDGKTYTNQCELKCARQSQTNLTHISDGACNANKINILSEECKCHQIWKPVCASNGKTYDNYCFLECDQLKTPNLELVETGPCDTIDSFPAFTDDLKDCGCSRKWSPVCGSDNVTYVNDCHLTCAKGQNPSLELVMNKSCTAMKEIEAFHYLPSV